MRPLAMLEQQLWGPALSDDARIVVNPSRDPAWIEVESYRVLPRVGAARMLLPDGPRRAVVGSLLNYRGLRRRRENLVRTVLGSAARIGLPLPFPRLVVQVRHDAATPVLPLATLADALGHEKLFASIGVRTGANRKATLQLVDAHGAARGYAKFGWNSIADQFVATEAAALADLPAPTDSGMRAPRLLAHLDFHGHPVVITEALPPDVVGAYGDASPPSPQELHSLCPVHRTAPIRSTKHFIALAGRVGDLSPTTLGPGLTKAVRDLVTRIHRLADHVAVSRRWHGDLTAWNCARDSTGQLWAWDWESSEPDAAAGLDALHWEFSQRRLPRDGPETIQLADCVAAVRTHLVAAGTPVAAHASIAAVYALTVVERAAGLAERNGGWSTVWISPATLSGLVDQATRLVSA